MAFSFCCRFRAVVAAPVVVVIALVGAVDTVSISPVVFLSGVVVVFVCCHRFRFGVVVILFGGMVLYRCSSVLAELMLFFSGWGDFGFFWRWSNRTGVILIVFGALVLLSSVLQRSHRYCPNHTHTCYNNTDVSPDRTDIALTLIMFAVITMIFAANRIDNAVIIQIFAVSLSVFFPTPPVPSLDNLLCKGLILHHVVEIVGRSSTGKTQASTPDPACCIPTIARVA